MAHYYFERECRTPNSECYAILENEASVGRVDLHYTPSIVHATLCVNESLTQESINELIEVIDDELLDSVGITREEFIVHVHQGRDMGVFSDQQFSQNGGDEGS
ncbi:MAG: hypothetical protein HYU29_02350 [Chloroflexi bacterium]|nr:hypothetical protein [Chloroflexota bacterium]